MKRRVGLVLALVLLIAGCAGAGPSASPGTHRPRCGSNPGDDQRPLFFILCVQSP